jgi:recombination protein RecR
MHPPIIQSLITAFSRFPSIGPKTAERFVFCLLKQPKEDLKKLSSAIQNLKDKIKFCSSCFNLCENEIDSPPFRSRLASTHLPLPKALQLARPKSSAPGLCSICQDPKRDQTTLCVVAEVQDLEVLEKTRQYQGVYHILGGTLNALEGVTPEKLRIKELINRISGTKNPRIKIREIILALDSNLEGETTILYLTKLLKPFKVRLTRLARGLPMGSDLEYADEITLSNALRERKDV